MVFPITKFEPPDPNAPQDVLARKSELQGNKPRAVIIALEPQSSPLAWLKERFGWRRRRAFWILFATMCVVTFGSSGYLIGIVLAGVSWLAYKIPVLAPLLSTVFNPQILTTVQMMITYSPTDQAFGGIARWAEALGPAGQSSFQFGLVALGSVMLVRAVDIKPSHILIGSDGLRLKWRHPWLKGDGPLVPWSEIKSIRVIRPRDATASHSSFVEFEYSLARWQYFFTSSVSKAARKVFRVRLSQLEQSPQRDRILSLLQENAPAYVTDAAVLEAIAPAASQSYTELWLTALTAPSKRERTEPLPPGTALQNGNYVVRSQLGVGGQGIAYVAQCKQQTPGGITETHPQQLPLTGSRDLAAEISHSIRIAEGDNSLYGEGGSDEQDVVLKELVLPLFVETDARKTALDKFLKEAELLRSLNHRQIVKLNHCFVEDHRGYLVLEKISGASLKDIVLKEGALPEDRVIQLLEQMLDILEYLHSREPPVVHRDFTPDNLLLDDSGTLKLVDFNVAQQVDEGVTGTVVGKHCYVPSEQIRGMAMPQSDIYAMGATLHFLLTGEEPEPLSVSHPKATNHRVSEGLDSLVAQATQLEPEDRFASSADVRVLLYALKSGPESMHLHQSE